MNYRDIERLCRLVRDYTVAAKRMASLERRIVRLLADTPPEYTALRDSTLGHLATVLAGLIDASIVSPDSDSDDGLCGLCIEDKEEV
jgi:hypothetical protein